MECPNCGKVIPDEAKACPFCLYQLRNKENTQQNLPKVAITSQDSSSVFVPHRLRQKTRKSKNAPKANSADFQSTRRLGSQKAVTGDLTTPVFPKGPSNSPTSSGLTNKEGSPRRSHRNSTGPGSPSPSNSVAVTFGANSQSSPQPKKRFRGQRFFRGVLVLGAVLLLGVLAFFSFHWFTRQSIAGQTIESKQFEAVQATFSTTERQPKKLAQAKELTIKLTDLPVTKIPVKNVQLLANGEKVNFTSNQTVIKTNSGQMVITGKVSDLKQFANNFALVIMSDQKKLLYQSKPKPINYPILLSGTYWQVVYKSDVNSPERILKLFFKSPQSYEQNLTIKQQDFADTKKIQRWWQKASQGQLQTLTSDDGSDRFATKPQQMIETEFLSNYQHGKQPITRLSYDRQHFPDNLNDYQWEIRQKNNQLYFFLPGATPQVKTQIFLFKQIKASNFSSYQHTAALPQVKQPGLLAQPQTAIVTRRRILTNFVDQLPYEMPLKDQAHLDTVFVDNPNGQQTTGLITYYAQGKVVNLMKFVLYRNGRLNAYPLSSNFDVPKAYTLNLYQALKNNKYEQFPDFKK